MAHIITSIQLLLRGGSIQGLGFESVAWDSGSKAQDGFKYIAGLGIAVWELGVVGN